MKLRDCIESRDYSQFKECKYPTFSNYYDTLSCTLYTRGQSIDYEVHGQVEQSGRIKQYAIREWLCTDTHVGLYLYIVDNEPVCLSYQSGRKMYPEWTFFSEQALLKTRALFDEFMLYDKPIYCDDPTSILDLYIDEKLFDSEVTPVQKGLSPFHQYRDMIGSMWAAVDTHVKEHVIETQKLDLSLLTR